MGLREAVDQQEWRAGSAEAGENLNTAVLVAEFLGVWEQGGHGGSLYPGCGLRQNSVMVQGQRRVKGLDGKP